MFVTFVLHLLRSKDKILFQALVWIGSCFFVSFDSHNENCTLPQCNATQWLFLQIPSNNFQSISRLQHLQISLIVLPYMLALILDLILGPHVKERCILPLQTSHAQHCACLCGENMIKFRCLSLLTLVSSLGLRENSYFVGQSSLKKVFSPLCKSSPQSHRRALVAAVGPTSSPDTNYLLPPANRQQ